MEVDQSWRVVLRNYFYLVYERYGITPPEEAEWSLPQLPATVPWLIAVEVPTMLMELGEVNKKTRIPAMVKQCEDISEHILESNCVAMYSTMVNVLLDNSPSLGKMQVFCAFSVSFCIYLRKYNMSDHAAKEVYKIANELFEVRFKSWMITNQGWGRFLSEGKRVLREKQIANYQVSLLKRVFHNGIIVTMVTGIAIILVASLKSGPKH